MAGVGWARLWSAGVLGAALLSSCGVAQARQQEGQAGPIRERLLNRDRTPAASTAVAETMVHGGLERRYLVHDHSGGARAPVVIAMHGGGGNAENAVNMTQFDALAAREKFIVVYPEGTARPGVRLLTWNAGHCCAFAMENKTDDVGYISALIDRLVADGRADPDRIYVTGMSNGAMMSHRIGRELSNKVAAIAPVVGAVFGDEAPPAARVPAFIIVGADDTVVPAAGGSLSLRGILGNRSAADKDVAPAVQQAEYWARANGCTSSKTVAAPEAVSTRWTGCRNGADVVYNVVANNGHAWPGGRAGREGANVPSAAYNASEQMWAFFKAHPKR